MDASILGLASAFANCKVAVSFTLRSYLKPKLFIFLSRIERLISLKYTKGRAGRSVISRHGLLSALTSENSDRPSHRPCHGDWEILCEVSPCREWQDILSQRRKETNHAGKKIPPVYTAESIQNAFFVVFRGKGKTTCSCTGTAIFLYSAAKTGYTECRTFYRIYIAFCGQ